MRLSGPDLQQEDGGSSTPSIIPMERQLRVTRIVEAVSAGAIVAAAALLAFGPVPNVDQWRAAAFFAAFGVLALVLAYKTSRTTAGNIGFLPFLSLAIVSPNIVAVATVFVSILVTELLVRRAPLKAAFNVAQFVLAEAVAVCVFALLDGRAMTGHLDARGAISFFAMVAIWLALNKLAVSTVVAAADGRNAYEHWISSMRLSAAYDVLSFPLIYFFAYAYVVYDVGVTSMLALPLLGVRQLYKQNIALQKINEELLQLMVATVEAQDPYTSGHSQRVARYARVIAKAVGIGGQASERVAVAALLHDVGKIYGEFAPILRKPGRLTDAEYDVMKTHPARGASLVEKVTHFADLVPAVMSHHEAWDGRGYPHGLAGDAIPETARVIALADTIDAMSTSRPYRDALSADIVHAEIVKESGRQFDPRMCAALLRPESWRELVSEMAIATREYPVATDRAAHKDGEPPRSVVLSDTPKRIM